jgi:hypothetical protein
MVLESDHDARISELVGFFDTADLDNDYGEDRGWFTLEGHGKGLCPNVPQEFP